MLTIPRIKLLRNRREIQIKQMRRDIAKLLETGQEATARIRVEHIIREENMMAAQEIIELFCELISVRIPIIETQRECPLDLKEAISSVCFAAPRCADLPELMPVQMLFVSNYGKEFVAAATELRPDCGVNRQLIELLSVRAPAPEKKLKLLTEIAQEHGLDWDPTSSEIEIFKRPEDLLNGPSQFESGSVLPLPKEKVLTMEPFPSQCLNEDYGADSDSDGLDFPEVPKISVRPKVNEPVKPPAIPPVSATDNKSSKEEAYESTHHQSDLKEEETTQRGTGIKTYELLDEVKTVNSGQYQSYMPPPLLSSPSFPAESGNDVNVDLQDVLAAAQAAADSAERAASAARSAASLAQLRINELVKKKNDEVFESSPSFSSHDEVAHELITTGNAIFDNLHSFDGSPVLNSPLTDKHPWEHPKLDSDSMRDHVEEVKFGSYGSFGNGSQPELTRDHVEEVKFDSYGSFGNGSQPEITRDHVEEVKFDSYGSFGNGSQPEITRDHVEEVKIGLYGSFGNGSQPEITRDHVEEVKFGSYGSFGNGSQPELTRDHVEEVKFGSYGSFGNGSQPELTRDHVEEVKFDSYGSFGNGSQPEITRDHVEEVKFDSYGSFGNGSQPEITRDHVEEVKIGLYGSFGNGSQPEITRDHVEEVKFGSYGSFGNGSQPELTRDHVEEVKFGSYGSFGNGSQPELTRDHVEEVKFDSYGSFGNGSQPEITRDHVEEVKIGLYGSFGNGSQPEITRDHVEEVKLDSYGSFGNGSHPELTQDHAEEVKFDSYGSFGNGSQPELTRDRVEEVKFDSCDSFGNGSQPVLTQEQPQRCTSMDDDSDFSYHNLFSSKRDNDEASDHSADTATKSGSF